MSFAPYVAEPAVDDLLALAVAIIDPEKLGPEGDF
jgi:hypothetical protein